MTSNAFCYFDIPFFCFQVQQGRTGNTEKEIVNITPHTTKTDFNSPTNVYKSAINTTRYEPLLNQENCADTMSLTVTPHVLLLNDLKIPFRHKSKLVFLFGCYMWLEGHVPVDVVTPIQLLGVFKAISTLLAQCQ